jgi:hypothetical protein
LLPKLLFFRKAVLFLYPPPEKLSKSGVEGVFYKELIVTELSNFTTFATVMRRRGVGD